MALRERRVLAVVCGPRADVPGAAAAVEELQGHPTDSLQVEVLRDPTLAELAQRVQAWQPSLVLLGTADQHRQAPGAKLQPLAWRAAAGHAAEPGSVELAPAFQGCAVDAVFFDAPGCGRHGQPLLPWPLTSPHLACHLQGLTVSAALPPAEAARGMGVRHALHWAAASVPAATAAQFTRTLLASLRDPTCLLPEAVAIAGQATRAHCAVTHGGASSPPSLPRLLSDGAAALPDAGSIPPPDLPGVSFAGGSVIGIPGWEELRLLAPHAELRLQLCGQPALLESPRLSAVALALRALLVQEVRCATLQALDPCAQPPGHLPSGAAAARCRLLTRSGVPLTVVLGGPPATLELREVAQLALRHALTADALSLQLRLPGGQTLPHPARSVRHVAGGCPVVEAAAAASVWAAALLHGLAQAPGARGLVAAGVAAIGGIPVAAFGPADATHYAGLQPGLARLAVLAPANAQPAAEWEGFTFGGEGGGAAAAQPPTKAEAGGGEPEAQREAKPYASTRPPLAECSEEQWLADYLAFCGSRQGRRLKPETWPRVALNGRPLDLFRLYCEVVQRGGFGSGGGINWGGQIYPRLRNHAPEARLGPGVGPALQAQYQQLLLEYEQAHPEDVEADTCALCGGGGEAAADWVCCDACEAWVHLSCDGRPGLGAFADYAREDGLAYHCPSCAQPEPEG